MPAVLAILFGASFTVATAWALGAILIGRLSLTLYRAEERLFGFLLGSACLSALMFALAALKMVRRGILLPCGMVLIGYAIYSGALHAKGASFPPIPRLWKLTFAAAFGLFTVLYFFNALAPEVSPDGMAYHLGEVAKYARAHGFVRITTNMYGNLSQGVELLFLYAFLFGKHSAAALVHYAFFLCVTLLILSYGRRLEYPRVGVAAAIFFYASSVIGMDGTIAYNDVAVAAIAFGLFYLLQMWDRDRTAKLLVPIGILTGFAFSVKYTAVVAVPYALGFIAWKQWRARQAVLRPALNVALVAALFIAPWLLKNWIWVDNPFSPFANRVFPNPYVHIAFEEEYRKLEQTYGLTSRWQIPWEVTVNGNLLAGFFGPLFLLTPIALIALRRPVGRQLWLAAAIFALPFYANVGSRFLIPAMPFVSFALALTFANVPSLLLMLAIAHAVSCWPPVEKLYCYFSAWRLNNIPYRAALRIEPEAAFLRFRAPQYEEAQMIERLVPAGEKVLSFQQMADSYLSRESVVSYQAAFNEVAQDILWTPVFNSFQPTRLLTFRFPPRGLRAVRVVQTARAKDVQWGISELRIYDGANELPRSPEWRLRAHPNPWDVQMAFDNSPVTRWRSWQVAEPGMFVEVNFGKAQTVSAVVVESSDEGYKTKIKLEGLDAQGNWSTILNDPVETSRPITVNLRRTATEELKTRGIRYFLIEKGDFRADDFQVYANYWGIKCIGEVPSQAWLYRIE
ncbi:MAG TPA: glycosyltransferase family 39 protein [Bryobacteraceae bacterium]|nr:glycosyltransferase family 39 protein [Bryobacteraceae bacterium]